ncbi:beta-ketoacyl synthase chain length factor [Paramagnetospirillum kuznetsovii]|nr:beta-ketoacyl synthase chain length factor [Paramagnetospirillum kuznetsovii]
MADHITFNIAGWAAWTGDAWALSGTVQDEERNAVPASLKRRVSACGRKALEAAWAVLPQGAAPRLVLSSRHGEYQRTYGLLISLAEDGSVSPAEFSLSVHHALVGLLSIATANRAGHTAIAAGEESFAYGLLEAAVSVGQDMAPVLLIHFDEPLPACYAAISESDPPAMALAVLLTPGGDGEAVAMVRAQDDGIAAEKGIAQEFLDFLGSGESARRSGRWSWRRVA